MLSVKHFFTILFIGLSSFCLAQQQHYYILFSARFASFRPFSIGGHAFITWRSEDPGFQKVEQLTFGFFPKKHRIFKNVAGGVVEGYVKNSNRERLVRRFMIEVDSLSYAETLNSVAVWNEQAYNLLDNNCVDFMNDMALRLGLNIPPTQTWIFPKKPSSYIRRLKKLNRDRIIKNAILERVRLRMLRKAEIDDEDDDDDDDDQLE
jgi:hypothetical protein